MSRRGSLRPDSDPATSGRLCRPSDPPTHPLSLHSLARSTYSHAEKGLCAAYPHSGIDEVQVEVYGPEIAERTTEYQYDLLDPNVQPFSIEHDIDHDDVLDGSDNCTLAYNPVDTYDPNHRTTTGGQLDDDGDGYGNQCDADYDNDGTVTAVDEVRFKTCLGHTPPAKVDDDPGCGINGDDPNDPCDGCDLDGQHVAITALDTAKFVSLKNKAAGPKCAACPLDCEGDNCP